MDIGWKVASAASVAGAGFVADRLIDLIWKGFTGHKPPRGSEDEAVANMLEVALFGALSGLTVGLIQRLAVRGTSKWYGGKNKNALANSQK